MGSVRTHRKPPPVTRAERRPEHYSKEPRWSVQKATGPFSARHTQPLRTTFHSSSEQEERATALNVTGIQHVSLKTVLGLARWLR